MVSFLVGFGSALLTPHEPVPLAGYASAERRVQGDVDWTSDHAWTWFRPNEGVHDDIEAKAMVLEVAGQRYAFVGVDLVAVSADMAKKVAKQLDGIAADHIVIGASHTHSGPGAMSRAVLWQLLALDAFKERIEAHVIARTAEAIKAAVAQLQPAKLAVGSSTIEGVISNRRGNDELQPRLVLMRVDDAEGKPLGVLYNFPIHGTSLPASNLQLSADNIGFTRRAIERRVGVPAVFFNGAEGDVSPDGRGFAGATEMAERVAERVEQMHAGLSPQATMRFDWKTTEVTLPRSTVHVAACDTTIAAYLGSALTLPVTLAETEVSLAAWRFNDTAFVTLPGEAITALGRDIEARIVATGAYRDAVVIGLANGYTGYVLTRAEYDRGGYESCASTYGADFGAWLSNAIVANVAGRAPSPKRFGCGESHLELAFAPLLLRRRRVTR